MPDNITSFRDSRYGITSSHEPRPLLFRMPLLVGDPASALRRESQDGHLVRLAAEDPVVARIASSSESGRFAVIQAAEELYGVGSREALRSAEAFDAVGIIDVPTNPNPDPIAPVDGDDSVIFTFFDTGTGECYLGRREADLGDRCKAAFSRPRRSSSRRRP